MAEIRQCKAILILYSMIYNTVDVEHRCVLNVGHDDYHIDGLVGWTADD